MIYLDNASTTFPKPECVYDAVDMFNRNGAVNAGRGIYKKAVEATEMVKEVKQMLLELCNAEGKASVALTPSATIAMNQIIFGQKWDETKHFYFSMYEHNAVMRPMNLAREKYGINIHRLPHHKEDLSLDIEAIEKLFDEFPPNFIALTALSNVTGYIPPFKEIFRLAKKYNAFTVLDASQAMGFMPLDFEETNADVIVFAGHKTLYATFGIAGFMIRNGVDMDEVLAGGNGINSVSLKMPETVPAKFECGSMDTPAIAGLHSSLKWLKTVDTYTKEKEMMQYLIDQIEMVPFIKIYKAPGGMENQGGVLSFNLEELDCSVVGGILDEKYDIAVRAGHHCAPSIHRYLNSIQQRGVVRVSVGYFTTKEDIDTLVKGLREIDLVEAHKMPVRVTC